MILGVTGCPGSGKSVLARVIAGRGWKLVDADILGKELVEGSVAILTELARIFGQDIIGHDGKLDRRLLARRAFASAGSTAMLNHAVHPTLIRKTVETIESLRSAGTNTVVDCALIFEWEIKSRFDRIVCVRADEATRRKRLMERDHRTPEDIDRLFSAQLSENTKVLKSHIALANNGPIEDIAAYGFMLAELPQYENEGKEWLGNYREHKAP